MRLFLRLTPEVDGELRSRRRYRGDLSRIVDTAIATINLETVKLIAETPKRLTQVIATVRRENDELVREIAHRRNCTVSTLANSAIWRWLSSHPGERA